MLVAIEELPLFLACEVDPIAHSMRWRWVCILTFSTGTFRQCCPTLPMVSLRLSATTDHSDVSGWRGDAITQNRLFYQSIFTTIMMLREQIQLKGKILKLPFIPSVHIIYLIHPFSLSIMTEHSRLSNLSWSIQQCQWYSHPPLRAGRSRRWLFLASKGT